MLEKIDFTFGETSFQKTAENWSCDGKTGICSPPKEQIRQEKQQNHTEKKNEKEEKHGES